MASSSQHRRRKNRTRKGGGAHGAGIDWRGLHAIPAGYLGRSERAASACLDRRIRELSDICGSITCPSDSEEITCILKPGLEPAQIVILLGESGPAEHSLPRRAFQIADSVLRTIRTLPGKKVATAISPTIEHGRHAYDIMEDGTVGYDPSHEGLLLGHLARAAVMGGSLALRQFCDEGFTAIASNGAPVSMPRKLLYLFDLSLDGVRPVPEADQQARYPASLPRPSDEGAFFATATPLACGELLPLPEGFAALTPLAVADEMPAPGEPLSGHKGTRSRDEILRRLQQANSGLLADKGLGALLDYGTTGRLQRLVFMKDDPARQVVLPRRAVDLAERAVRHLLTVAGPGAALHLARLEPFMGDGAAVLAASPQTVEHQMAVARLAMAFCEELDILVEKPAADGVEVALYGLSLLGAELAGEQEARDAFGKIWSEGRAVAGRPEARPLGGAAPTEGYALAAD